MEKEEEKEAEEPAGFLVLGTLIPAFFSRADGFSDVFGNAVVVFTISRITSRSCEGRRDVKGDNSQLWLEQRHEPCFRASLSA